MIFKSKRIALLLVSSVYLISPVLAFADGQPWRIEREGFNQFNPGPSLSGGLNYEFPINIPPGRGAMTPDVKLTYSSQNSDNLSPFGYGWSLNTPYIERVNKLGTDQLYDRYDFFSSIDGEIWGATTTPGEGSGSTSTTTTIRIYASAGDGMVRHAYDTNWATCRDASSANLNHGTEPLSNSRSFKDGTADNRYGVERAFLPFDTSIIPDTAAVTSATLYLYASDKQSATDLVLVKTTQAASSTLDNADFSRIVKNSPSEGATRKSTNDWTIGQYSGWALNATGTAWITATSTTFLGVRESHDVDNSQPGNNSYYGMEVAFSEATGTTTDPYIEITYTYDAPSDPFEVTEYAPRFDNGDFRKYHYEDDAWVITDKKGVTYKFGTATTSRLDNSGDESEVYRWMLDGVRDTHGNYIKYTYYKNAGQIYPDQIIYTGNGSTDGPFEVNFTREARIDIATSSKTGFDVVSNYRISDITTEVDNNWVRAYALDYTAGSNGRRAVLTSITESGQQEDLSSNLSFPSTVFTYTASTTGWNGGSAWTMPAKIIFDRNDYGRLDDLNGDGFPDLYVKKTGAATVDLTYLSQGNSWSNSDNSSYHLPDNILVSTTADNGVRIADINGDGFNDVVKGNNGDRNVWINNATTSGWTASTTWAVPTDFVDSMGADTYARLADINGDGLTDIVKSPSTTTDEVWLNNGSGWATSTEWSLPVAFNGGTRFGELNGDGLVDIVESTAEPLIAYANGVYINNGRGWTKYNNWTLPFSFATINGYDYGVRFADLNGDGLSDVIQSSATNGTLSATSTFINNGYGWQQDNGWVLPIAITDLQTGFYHDKGVRILDINGDNMPDVQQSYTHGANPEENNTYLNKGRKVDLLSKVTTIHGGSESYVYSTDAYGKDPTAHNQFPYIVDILKNRVKNDGLGNISTTTYAYSGGKYNFINPLDRRLAGFATTTTSKYLPDGNQGFFTRTYYHQGDSTDASLGEYSDDVSKIGKPFRIEKLDNAERPVDITINKWDRADLDNNRDFVKLTQTVNSRVSSDFSTSSSKAQTFEYDGINGNLATSTFWGEVSASTSTGAFTDIGTDKATTTISYAASSTGYLLLPSVESTLNQSGTKIKETRHYYDSLSLGSNTFGDETKTEFWKSGSSYASTTRIFDSTYGLVATSTDPNGNSVAFSYESRNLYPGTTTNPKLQKTVSTYDYSSGKVKQTTDLNSRIYTTTYDAFDRVATTTIPDPDTGSSVTKSEFFYTDSTTTPWSIYEKRYLNSATTTDMYSYFDGLDRKVQERKEAEGTNTYAVKDSIYDSLEFLQKESLPYFASSTAYTSATTTGSLFTNYTYNDPLMRISTSSNAVGTTTYTYSGWRTTITDPKGTPKDFSKDAYDNLANVLEYIGTGAGTTTASTTYSWDLNKNLTKITDALGNVRNFTYDGMNRRLTAEDLHAVGDSYFGIWNYAYDDAGNATSTTDAKGQVIQKTFDSLNRILTENYTGAAGTEITYSYDGCNDGVGKLCGATTTAASTNYVYTPNGLVKRETKTIGGTDYVSSYGYDRLGNMASTTYPDNAQVIYTYDDAGLLEKVRTRENNTNTFTALVAETNYSPLEQVRYRLFGNNASTTNTYDATKLYRLTRKVTSGVSSTTPSGGGSFLMGGGGEGEGEGELSLLNFGNQHFSLAVEILEINPEDILEAIEESNLITETSTPAEILATTTEENIEEVTEEEAPVATSTEEIISPDVFPLMEGEIEEETTPIPTEIIATTTEETASTAVRSKLEGKSAEEKADIKGQEIAKTGPVERTSRENYDIEIASIEPIKGGVQAFVRAWQKDGTQIGFGTDGSVDMERFRIFNPPILITDPQGDILQTWTDGEEVQHTRTLREDPREALLQVIEHNLSVMKNIHGSQNIIEGKHGNTTSTFYPAAGANSPVDGMTHLNYNYGSGSETNFNTIVTRDDALQATVSVPSDNVAGFYSGFSNWGDIYRGFFLFDTSPIGSDTITAATLSLYGSDKSDQGGNGADVNVYSSTPASTSNIVTADHDQIGNTAFSTAISQAGWNTAGYNNFSLNTSGKANIDKMGISKFGTANENFDTANRISSAAADPSYGQNTRNHITAYYADESGTTNDPKLVVETSSTGSSPGTNIQDLNYEYDAAGNIIEMEDLSSTNTYGVSTYTYDSINRLTEALIGATQKTYTYNLIGNISSSTDKGSYLYLGTTTSNYANPHAPTSINADSYTYDNNGNLTGNGTFTNEWDYRNRLATTTHSGLTEKYFYDHTDQRIRFQNSTTTINYPFTFYSTSTVGTTTKYVMANGEPIARIVSSTTNPVIFYVHVDHLGSPQVVSDQNAVMAEVMSYYPFGETHVDDKVTSNSPKKFINQDVDPSTGLSYLNARYYEGSRGQFLSQDPVHLVLGDLNQVKQLSERDQQKYLEDPQQLNSYSYAANNPINKKDPTGRCVGPLIELAPGCIGVAYGVAETRTTNSDASLGQLVLGGASGFVQGMYFEGRVIYSAATGFVTSIGQDLYAKQTPNISKAVVSAAANAVAVGTIKTAVTGVSNIAAQSGGQLVFTPTTNAVKSSISGGYQAVNNIYAQNTFSSITSQSSANSSMASKSTSPATNNSGGIINSVKNLISNIFK